MSTGRGQGKNVIISRSDVMMFGVTPPQHPGPSAPSLAICPSRWPDFELGQQQFVKVWPEK